jgi:hypothetical protein
VHDDRQTRASPPTRWAPRRLPRFVARPDVHWAAPLRCDVRVSVRDGLHVGRAWVRAGECAGRGVGGRVTKISVLRQFPVRNGMLGVGVTKVRIERVKMCLRRILGGGV